MHSSENNDKTEEIKRKEVSLNSNINHSFQKDEMIKSQKITNRIKDFQEEEDKIKKFQRNSESSEQLHNGLEENFKMKQNNNLNAKEQNLNKELKIMASIEYAKKVKLIRN